MYLCSIIISCQPLVDCKLSLDSKKEDECMLILKEIPDKTDGRFGYKGINPINKEECDCNSAISDRWWSEYNDDIEI